MRAIITTIAAAAKGMTETARGLLRRSRGMTADREVEIIMRKLTVSETTVSKPTTSQNHSRKSQAETRITIKLRGSLLTKVREETIFWSFNDNSRYSLIRNSSSTSRESICWTMRITSSNKLSISWSSSTSQRAKKLIIYLRLKLSAMKSLEKIMKS